MVNIVWTEFAFKDLINIAEYIELGSLKFAKITINNLYNSTKKLEMFPKSGRIVPEFQNPNIRELIKGNYRIVYKILENNRIDILTIHHSKKSNFDIEIGN